MYYLFVLPKASYIEKVVHPIYSVGVCLLGGSLAGVCTAPLGWDVNTGSAR